jgi:hypothetical protein
VKGRPGTSCERDALVLYSARRIGPNPLPFVVLHLATTTPKVVEATLDVRFALQSLCALIQGRCGCGSSTRLPVYGLLRISEPRTVFFARAKKKNLE